MEEIGMSRTTCKFIKHGFTNGFDYAFDIPLTGLYEKVEDKKISKFPEKPLTLVHKRTGNNETLFSERDFLLPGSHESEIYAQTIKENENGVYLGPFKIYEKLPVDIAPCMRFWVLQDTATGADPGRAVDDMTANGVNGRSPIYEKLVLPTLD